MQLMMRVSIPEEDYNKFITTLEKENLTASVNHRGIVITTITIHKWG